MKHAIRNRAWTSKFIKPGDEVSLYTEKEFLDYWDIPKDKLGDFTVDGPYHYGMYILKPQYFYPNNSYKVAYVELSKEERGHCIHLDIPMDRYNISPDVIKSVNGVLVDDLM